MKDNKKNCYDAAEEIEVLRRAMEEDSWEAYAEAQFIEDHGSGESFFKAINDFLNDK